MHPLTLISIHHVTMHYSAHKTATHSHYTPLLSNQKSSPTHVNIQQSKVILMALLSFQFLSSIVYMPLAQPQKQRILVHCQKNKAVHPARPGKYDELLQAGYDFVELVATHDSSMELVESTTPMGDRELPLS